MMRITCQWSRNPECGRLSWNWRYGKDPLPNNPARGAQSECSVQGSAWLQERKTLKPKNKGETKGHPEGIIFLGADFNSLHIPAESSGLCPIGWSFLCGVWTTDVASYVI